MLLTEAEVVLAVETAFSAGTPLAGEPALAGNPAVLFVVCLANQRPRQRETLPCGMPSLANQSSQLRSGTRVGSVVRTEPRSGRRPPSAHRYNI